MGAGAHGRASRASSEQAVSAAAAQALSATTARRQSSLLPGCAPQNSFGIQDEQAAPEGGPIL